MAGVGCGFQKREDRAQKLAGWFILADFLANPLAAGVSMHESRPSRTANRVALRRAAHQLVDDPPVFIDPLAMSIVGSDAASELLATLSAEQALAARIPRAFMAVRSRYAEDQLGLAVERGVRQYVVLGAGLDTFAYRNPYRQARLRVFEVDHPATQAWKRELLSAAGISIPAELAFAPIDFERQTLGHGLPSAGFDPAAPAFFSWLGVTPYLTLEAFTATLRFVLAMPPGSGVAFDYVVVRSALNPRERMALDALSARVAAAGEPFQLFFEPRDLVSELERTGFRHIEDLGPAELNARYFHGRSDDLRVIGGLGRLLSAQVAAKS
jgi:methyltransferase (TIGR00027 family)